MSAIFKFELKHQSLLRFEGRHKKDSADRCMLIAVERIKTRQDPSRTDRKVRKYVGLI